MRVVPFDVPGHKRGRGNPELVKLLGEQCVGLDINSMKPMDNLCHPVSVIRSAEELAAEAFGASHCFLMVGGTTSSVQSMILSVCKRGDKIILPRNVHRSVINSMILCGAHPVYVNPEVNTQLGIPLGMKVEQVRGPLSKTRKQKRFWSTIRPISGSVRTCVRLWRWLMHTICLCLQTKHTERISILAPGFRYPQWKQGRIWLPSACTNREGA